MKLSIATLRAAGLSDPEIIKVLEEAEATSDAEKARTRQLNTERVARWRAKHKKRASTKTKNGPVERVPVTRRKVGVVWPGYDACPPEWRALVPFRTDREITYAFERFRNWATAKDIRFARWDAAWRNCAGASGWAFDPRGNGNGGHPTPSRQQFAEALDLLDTAAQGPVSYPGGPSAPPVRPRRSH